MLGMPGETFVELGLEFKRWAPLDFPYVVGYTNGYAGYFPTQKAHEEGGYGANYGDTVHLAADSGEKMVSLGLEWVNKRQWLVPMPSEVSSGIRVNIRGKLSLEGLDRHYLVPKGKAQWDLDWQGQIEWPTGWSCDTLLHTGFPGDCRASNERTAPRRTGWRLGCLGWEVADRGPSI